MFNIFFSPEGEIHGPDFMRAAVMLIAIGAALAVLPKLAPMLGILKILMLPIVWCWIVLFVKRMRAGGKSGWVALLPIAAYLVGYVILSNIVPTVFAPELHGEMTDLMKIAAEEGDFGAIMQINQQYAVPLADKIILPMAIAGAVLSYAVAAVTNKLLG